MGKENNSWSVVVRDQKPAKGKPRVVKFLGEGTLTKEAVIKCRGGVGKKT